jgi:hypothetical protein
LIQKHAEVMENLLAESDLALVPVSKAELEKEFALL